MEFKWDIVGVYIIPLILTFDPNFQRHIQVLGLYYTHAAIYNGFFW